MQFDKFDMLAIFLLIILGSTGILNKFFVFEKSINIIDFFSFFLTLFIALYFGNYLKNKENINSRNREILLTFLDKLDHDITNYKNFLNETSFNLVMVNRMNKSISYLIMRIPDLKKIAKINANHLDHSKIHDNLKSIHKILTMYTHEDVLDDKYKIESNFITLGQERRIELDKIFLDFQYHVTLLKIELSNI